MITLEISHSDSPQYIGLWEYDWNKLTLGGPKGLRYCSLSHPPIRLSIYKKKYIHFEADHYVDSISLDGRKVSFPFVAPLGSKIEFKYFTLIIRKFQESEYESLETLYKRKSKDIDLQSLEAKMIKNLLDEN
jgi:hypothetical protein